MFRWFTQCVTFNFFPTPDHELAYNLFSIIALYGIPLFIITFAYCVILCRISKKSKQSKGEVTARVYDDNGSDHGRLRRSGIGNIERAKSRTLKMTCVIVGAYVLCWTPYFVISAWYYFDRESARKVPTKVQRGLFIFAVSNSCINPIVYGMFTIKFKRELIRCCYCLQGHLRRRRQEDSYGLRRSLLFPWKRNSESSSSSRNEQRLMKLGRPTQGGDTTNQTLPTQGCRYSFVSPLTDVKASSSRASLSSVGREERVSFVGHNREERVSFGTVMLGVPTGMERPGLCSSFSAVRDDRANLNNFVRLGSVE
ncbi:hypothetical protein EGW08_003646 [Elysia chlorotica]|uniref:G-protein coupled receptors family 1 profile domain-containing protein n=1 Tax=Elysia chlorotica TaxID=188477 RepID=A0A433U4A3_ELYCH|nr:hypothetical protein EGW08_003646 [Elysia chlorotica]